MFFKNSKLKNNFILLSLFLAVTLGGCDKHEKMPELKPIFRVDQPIEVLKSDESLVRFTDAKTNLMGLKDRKGKVVIPARYRMIDGCNKFGICDVWMGKHHKHWYKIDKSGKILANSYFFDNGPDYYVAGLSRYVEKGKIGFIDHKAGVVIPAQFDWASPFFFNAPIAVVCQGCKDVPMHPDDGKGCCHSEIKGGIWGAINRKGQIIVPLEFDQYDASLNDQTITFFKGDERHQVFMTPQGEYKLVIDKRR